MKLKIITICFISLLFSSSIIAFDHIDQEEENNEEITTKQTIHENKVQHRTKLLSKISQNLDNPKGSIHWCQKTYIGGLLNIDFYNQTKPNFIDKNSNEILLSTAKINVDADLNDWVNAHIGLFYSDDKDRYYAADSRKHGIDAEEGYLMFVNFAQSPFYFSTGKRYLPFGRYHRYVILKSLTQQLSETKAPAAEIGFIDQSGLYGSLYIFHGADKIGQDEHTRINNYGALLGYEHLSNPFGLDIGIGFLHNMVDVGEIYQTLPDNHYHTHINALNSHIDIVGGPFDFIIRYVTALNRFNSLDFGFQRYPGKIRGARPQAGKIAAGYTFKTIKRNSKIDIGYQFSREAYNINMDATLHLPRNRVIASYGIDILSSVILEFEIARDRDYTIRHGGTNKYNNTATLRLTGLLL